MLLAVKVVTCTQDTPAGLYVELQEELVQGLVNKRWANVVNLYDVWKEQTTSSEKLCIAMDSLGSSLRLLLEQRWTYDGPPWMDIMRGIANGVSQAHQSCIVHGDLKPSNSSLPS